MHIFCMAIFSHEELQMLMSSHAVRLQQRRLVPSLKARGEWKKKSNDNKHNDSPTQL